MPTIASPPSNPAAPDSRQAEIACGGASDAQASRGSHVGSELADGWEIDDLSAFAAAVAGDGVTRARVAAQLSIGSGIDVVSVERLLALWPLGWDPQAMAARRGALVNAGPGPEADVALIAAGNMPVATWTAIAELLALGCSVRVRPASGDLEAAAAMCVWLAAVAPRLAARVQIWPNIRADRQGWRRLFDGVGAIVAFGGDRATAAIVALADEVGSAAAVRCHGDKLSLGWMDADVYASLPVSTRERWIDATLDACLLADGRGCLSLRALLVRGNGDDAVAIAGDLAARAAAAAARWPAGQLALELVAARRLAIEEDRLNAAVGEGVVWESAAMDDARQRYAIAARTLPLRALDATAVGPGARLLRVLPVAADVELPALLAPLAGHLAALAPLGCNDGATPRSATERAFAAQAMQAGFWRVCAPEALQAPPWHRHDGVAAGDGLSAAWTGPSLPT